MRSVLLCVALLLSCIPALAQAALPAEAQKSFDQGMTAAQQKQWDAAIQAFAEAQKLAPNEPKVLYNLGLAHEKAGHNEDAMVWFGAYLKAAPDAPNAAIIRKEIDRLSQANRALQPAASGPTMEETLRYIMDKVNEQGTMAYTETLTVKGRVNRLMVEQAPRATGTLPEGGVSFQIVSHSSFFGMMKFPGATTLQWNLLFRDVESVEVLGMQELTNRSLARSGLADTYAQLSGSTYALVAHLAPTKSLFLHEEILTGKNAKSANSSKSTDMSKWLSGELADCAIPFRDPETAQRVAKAMRHAIELSRSAGNREPF